MKVENSKEKKLFALVVDDMGICRIIHVECLRRVDFETHVVENGREIVDFIRSGEQFDVVFMDMEMPVLNGVQVIRELRTMRVRSMIVGIDCNRDYLGEYPIQAGMDRFYEKPMTVEIANSVRQALQNN